MNVGTVCALIAALAPAADPEVIEAAVQDWLDDHPEATTTVEDGSITEAKLATALAAKINGMDSDVSSLKSAIVNATGTVQIPMDANKYIDLSGTTVDVDWGFPYYASGTTTYSCGFMPCKKGDMFCISGTGGSATRLWAFVDEEGNILDKAQASASLTNGIITAPTDAAWIIVHTNDGKASYYFDMLSDNMDLIMNNPVMEATEWKQGSISSDDNHIIDSATRIYCETYFPFETDLCITFPSDMEYSIRAYETNGTIAYYSAIWLRKKYIPLPTVENKTIKTIRFVLKKQSNANISPSDVTSFTVSKREFTDKTLSKEGKAADAKAVGNIQEASPSSSMLGNMSIRAAKTINFADGTPPVIDWYLLQSVDSNFYMSKDLVNKKYLFTTKGSGIQGYIANWSAGITPNNDVIFVADAAGLSTSVNGRLSDDNRVNPVIFLASEGYSTAHVIDFGSSLKPCGWLNNVGFCTLPNGDIVFAEYTRGTVKTANVWLISGDITDPTNWSVTWSVDIIDTMDSTTPGTKHCHEVMYDFYTGILYFGTGDSETGSNSYYSTDGGENWTLLYGEDKNRCRRLNFIFTEDYVYWASDSWQTDDHHFFVGERDNDGLVDVENATEVTLTSGNGQACYGCVYLKEQNLIVMMDRIDDPVTKVLNWYCYDLTTGTVEKIGEIGSADDTLTYLGFRCRFMGFYPTGNAIVTGFSPRATSDNADTNCNKLCGNQGGTSGDGSTRINNLVLYVYKNGTDYSYRAKTLWI